MRMMLRRDWPAELTLRRNGGYRVLWYVGGRSRIHSSVHEAMSWISNRCGLLRVAVNIAAMLRKNEIEEEWTFPLLFDKIMIIRNELLRYIGCQSQWQLIVIIYRDTGWPLGPRSMLEPVSLGESEVNVQTPGSWLCSHKK